MWQALLARGCGILGCRLTGAVKRSGCGRVTVTDGDTGGILDTFGPQLPENRKVSSAKPAPSRRSIVCCYASRMALAISASPPTSRISITNVLNRLVGEK